MCFTRKKTRLGLAAASVALATNVAPANAAVIYSGEVNFRPAAGGTTNFLIDPAFTLRFDISNGALSSVIGFPNLGLIPTVNAKGSRAVVVESGDLIELDNFLNTYTLDEDADLYSNNLVRAFEFGEGGFVPFASSTTPSEDDFFGWLRFASGPDFESVVLVDYAYENVRGTSIVAGDTGVSPVPLPATLPLGLAGLGMLGLFGRFRRRRE